MNYPLNFTILPHKYFCFKTLVLCTLCLLFASNASAQNDPVQIKWEVITGSPEEGARMAFEGAQYKTETGLLPWFAKRIEGSSDIKAEILNPQYQDLTPEELKADFNNISSEPLVISENAIERKKAGSMISIFPFRKNAKSNKIEKLISFQLNTSYNISSTNSQKSAPRVYANSSVLANGDWYKIGVLEDGVYKISFDFLRSLGISSNNISGSSIRVFGNGGGMVPVLNSITRPDDLLENAIQLVDLDNNGLFNEGDYFLFYGQGPNRWAYSTIEKRYNHIQNQFTDTTYYFVTIDGGSGPAKRISTISNLSGSGNRDVTSFTDYSYHEIDKTNFIKSGRNWYGEVFDVSLSQNFSFEFPDLVPGLASIKSNVVGRVTYDGAGTVYNKFLINYNDNTILTHNIQNVSSNYTDAFGVASLLQTKFIANSSIINLNYIFQPYNSSSAGWLDYVSLNVTRSLKLSGGNLLFRDRDTLNSPSQSRYIISNAKSGLTLWNVTSSSNVLKQDYQLNGNTIEFVQNLSPGAQSDYILFDQNSFKSAINFGKIENQNLHALGFTPIDMIIVSSIEFMEEANKLADFHRTHDNLKVEVASLPNVFNEFSNGSRDVAAIRDFTKMIYDRATLSSLPRYLLLFGDGSYDLKNRINGNTDFIPTFQSENSLAVISSYTSDDFYGMMDDNEGTLSGGELMDIGVGRLPAKNTDEATTLVNKIISYSTPGTASEPTSCAGASTGRLGDWRNVLCFIADDQDFNLHFDQSEAILNNVKAAHPVYNIDQIVLDSYQQVSTPGGQRYPEVNDAINKRVDKGALLINYTGHGGEIGWAAEAILDVPMINSWQNTNKLPLFITATCEFSRFDDPLRTSAGELILLNSHGGGCALLTTVRLAFANENKAINLKMMDYMFTPINGEMPRIGDIHRLSKRDQPYNRIVTLLGDPALQLAYPKYKVQTVAIEKTGTSLTADTLSALSKITIKGKVTDTNGILLSGFNGVVYSTIYDKSNTIKTLVNDNTGKDKSVLDSFPLRKNVLYRGKASVVNGEFTSSFIVPRDISYKYGSGRLSLYANNDVDDANGYFENFIIGGAADSTISDAIGPDVRLYMNDEKFVFGGITSSDPSIYAVLFDSSGINTVGNGIGHDITAQLDNEPQKLFVLNDYYESTLDSYQKGVVIYKLSTLSEGLHTLKFKAWDINNNSSERNTEFIVSSSSKLALEHVLNYPNPFTTHTNFYFEHNAACSGMAVQVQVYTVSGKLVKTIDSYLVNQGFRNTSLEWDGKDDYGDQLARGVYIYKLKVRTADGDAAQKMERLVILR